LCGYGDNITRYLYYEQLVKDNIAVYRQNDPFNECEKYTTEELLLMFKTEAQSICKEPEEVCSIAESALNDFVKCYGKYVRLV